MKVKYLITLLTLFIFMFNFSSYGWEDPGTGSGLGGENIIDNVLDEIGNNGTMNPLLDPPALDLADNSEDSDFNDNSLTVDIPPITALLDPIDFDSGTITYDDASVEGLGLKAGTFDATDLTVNLANAAQDAFNKLAEVGAGPNTVMPGLPATQHYSVSQSLNESGNVIDNQYNINLNSPEGDTSGLSYTGVFTLDEAGEVGSQFHGIEVEAGVEGEIDVGDINFTTNGEEGDKEKYQYLKITEFKDGVSTSAEIERKLDDNVFKGNITQDALGLNGEGELNGVSVKVHSTYALDDDGYLMISEGEAEDGISFEEGGTQIWVENSLETFNYNTFDPVKRNLSKYDLEDIKTQINSQEQLDDLNVSDELLKRMQFSYVSDSTGLNPKELIGEDLVKQTDFKYTPINIGDIKVKIDGSLYTLDEVTAAHQRYKDKGGPKTLEEYMSEISTTDNTMYFQSENKRLLYLHQDMHRVVYDSGDPEREDADHPKATNDVFISDWGEENDLELNVPLVRLESSVSCEGGLTIIQVGYQKFGRYIDSYGRVVQQYRDFSLDKSSNNIYMLEGGDIIQHTAYSVSYELGDIGDNGDQAYLKQNWVEQTAYLNPKPNAFGSEVSTVEYSRLGWEYYYGWSSLKANYTDSRTERDSNGDLVYYRTRASVRADNTVTITDNVKFSEDQEVADVYHVEIAITEEGLKLVESTKNGAAVALQPNPDGTGLLGDTKLVPGDSQGTGSNFSGSPGSGIGSSARNQGSGNQDPGAGTPPTTNKVRNNLSDYVFQDGESLTNWAEATRRISHEVAEKLRNVDDAYLEENREQIQRYMMANAGLSSEQMSLFYDKMSEEGREAAIAHLTSLGLSEEQINAILNPILSDAKMYLLSFYDYTAEEINEYLRILSELSEEETLDYLMNDMGLSEEKAQEILGLETEDDMRAMLEELDIAMTEEEIEAMITMDEEEFLTEFMGYDEWTVNYILNPTLLGSEEVLDLIDTASDEVGFDGLLSGGEGDFEELQQEAAGLITAAVLNGEITPDSSQEDIIEILKRILEAMGIDLEAVKSTTDIVGQPVPSAGAYSSTINGDSAMPQYLDN